MSFLHECEEKISSLKVHEWIAIALLIGVVGGLACLTSLGEGEVVSLHGSLSQNGPGWVVKNRSRFDVIVKGAVEYPGIYHLHSDMKIKDLLAIAGVSLNADLRRFKVETLVKKGRVINVPAMVMLKVHLRGAVNGDQVVTIPKGSKLEDLIHFVNFPPDADLSVLKKKRRLKDDELIVIPSKSQERETAHEREGAYEGERAHELIHSPNWRLIASARCMAYRLVPSLI